MKSAPLSIAMALTLMLLGAGCGEDGGKQAATANSAQQPNDPYPEAAADPAVETPSQTQRDVLAAREDAREAESQTDAAAEIVAADSKRQVEIERCEARQGTEREQCIERANAEFERVKQRVRRQLDEDLKR
jgi:hypothetical protein